MGAGGGGIMRPGPIFALVLTLLVGVSPGTTADASTIGGLTGARGPAGQAQPCAAPLGAGRRPELGATLSYEEADVGPAARYGQPRVCLFSFPREEVFNVVLTGIDNVEQFRAAKTEAIGRLQAR